MTLEVELRRMNFNLHHTNKLFDSINNTKIPYSSFWEREDKICYSFTQDGFEECYFYEIEDLIEFDDTKDNENEQMYNIENENECFEEYTDDSDTDSDIDDLYFYE